MNVWNLKARFYHGIRTLPGIRGILDRERENLSSLVQNISITPKRVLDIGTGAGCSLNIFPESWFLIGMDQSASMLIKSRKRGNGACVVGDGNRPPVKNQSIDFVSAIGVTEYIRDKFGFLQVVRNILRPGGLFLVTFAPPHFLNRLRILLGSSLSFTPVNQWERLLAEAGFIQLEKKQSFFQLQYLFHLNSL